MKAFETLEEFEIVKKALPELYSGDYLFDKPICAKEFEERYFMQ